MCHARSLRRVLSILALTVLPTACGRDALPGGRDGAPAPLPQSTKLADNPVTTATEGPWRIRRAGTSGVDESVAFASGAVAPGGAPPPAPAPGGDAGPADLGGEAGAAANDAAPLRAGATDDNLDFRAFLDFLATWSDQEGVADRYEPLDVSTRRYLEVVDREGLRVPGARVQVVDERADRVVWSATTHGDGRAPFYPGVAGAEAPAGGWIVEAQAGSARVSARWNGEQEVLTLRMPVALPVGEPIRLDVCFVIDTTGSMSDEIERIKSTLLSVTERLRGLRRSFDLRYGAVLYRDVGDEYVTMTHPLSGDIEAFAKALAGVTADGGGDMPESLNQGLAEAVGRLDWRPYAARVAFLVADAPPHMDYDGDVTYGTSLRGAVERGIRIHAVAASGLDAFGSLVFRQIAQFTRGKFIFIEYGSPADSAASHGVSGPVVSNNLDDILFREIEEELEGWGRVQRGATFDPNTTRPSHAGD